MYHVIQSVFKHLNTQFDSGERKAEWLLHGLSPNLLVRNVIKEYVTVQRLFDYFTVQHKSF